MAARGLTGLAAVLLAGLAGPSWAVDPGDVSALRAVVDRQLEAFARDDGPAAYAFAAPGIRRMFPTPDQFMALVRQGYAPLVSPREHSFGETRDGSDGPDMLATFVDKVGTEWDAVYSFERQPDGSWAIAGCRLVKRPGEAV